MFEKLGYRFTTPTPLQAAAISTGVLGLVTLGLFWRSIKKRLDKIYGSTFFGDSSKDPFRLVRDGSLAADEDARHISVVDLNPDFVEQYRGKCKMMSLGTYLSTLRPSIATEELPQWLEGELQAALGLGIVRALGPTIGTALLPGTGFLDSFTGRIARLAVSFFMRKEGQSEQAFLEDALMDHSRLPLTLYNVRL